MLNTKAFIVLVIQFMIKFYSESQELKLFKVNIF